MIVTKAIVKNESEGNCNVKGGSGEIGCTQHMPDTWKWHSQKILGYVAPVTYTNEIYVTTHIVQDWIDNGLTDYQIGLKYNGGEVKAKKGINKFGVRYDSGAYAKKLVANVTKIQEMPSGQTCWKQTDGSYGDCFSNEDFSKINN